MLTHGHDALAVSWHLWADGTPSAGDSSTLNAAIVTAVAVVLVALINAVVKSRAREPASNSATTIADYARREAEARAREAEALARVRDAEQERDEWERRYTEREDALSDFCGNRGYNLRLIVRGDETDEQVRYRPRPTPTA